jgi:hypothetical protein
MTHWPHPRRAAKARDRVPLGYKQATVHGKEAPCQAHSLVEQSDQSHGDGVDWLQRSAGTTNNQGSSILWTGTFEPNYSHSRSWRGNWTRTSWCRWQSRPQPKRCSHPGQFLSPWCNTRFWPWAVFEGAYDTAQVAVRKRDQVVKVILEIANVHRSLSGPFRFPQ